MVILRPSRSTLVGLTFTLLHPEKSAADPSACTALRTADFSGLNTTILDATYHDGPANVTAIGTCTASAQIGTALCRVQFVVNTSSISSILAEAWLPEEWNERFLALGNGGLNGCKYASSVTSLQSI